MFHTKAWLVGVIPLLTELHCNNHNQKKKRRNDIIHVDSHEKLVNHDTELQNIFRQSIIYFVTFIEITLFLYQLYNFITL